MFGSPELMAEPGQPIVQHITHEYRVEEPSMGRVRLAWLTALGVLAFGNTTGALIAVIAQREEGWVAAFILCLASIIGATRVVRSLRPIVAPTVETVTPEQRERERIYGMLEGEAIESFTAQKLLADITFRYHPELRSAPPPSLEPMPRSRRNRST